MPDGDRVLQTLDPACCLELLGSRPVGLLVFTRHALPQVLPVNFRLHDGVVFRLAADSTAAAACHGSVVAFHVNDIDPAGRRGWSVTVVGRSDEVSSPIERERLAALPLESWLGDSRDHFIRIQLDQVRGREIVPAATSSPSGPRLDT